MEGLEYKYINLLTLWWITKIKMQFMHSSIFVINDNEQQKSIDGLKLLEVIKKHLRAHSVVYV